MRRINYVIVKQRLRCECLRKTFGSFQCRLTFQKQREVNETASIREIRSTDEKEAFDRIIGSTFDALKHLKAFLKTVAGAALSSLE